MRCLLFLPLLLILFNTVLCVFNPIRRYSSWKFCKQLEGIPIYYLKDKNGNIVKNVYNTLSRGTLQSNKWSPSKYKDYNKPIEWDVNMDSLPSSIIPLFIEEELAKAYSTSLGNQTSVEKGTLSDYLKWSESMKDTCILIPHRKSLDLCTKNNSFTGTPLFITNPPIKVNINGKPKGYALFISHSYALNLLGNIIQNKTVNLGNKVLSLEFYPNAADKVKSFLGFSDVKLKGIDRKHFTRVNCKIQAISLELLYSLVYNHPEIGDNIVIIAK